MGRSWSCTVSLILAVHLYSHIWYRSHSDEVRTALAVPQYWHLSHSNETAKQSSFSAFAETSPSQLVVALIFFFLCLHEWSCCLSFWFGESFSHFCHHRWKITTHCSLKCLWHIYLFQICDYLGRQAKLKQVPFPSMVMMYAYTRVGGFATTFDSPETIKNKVGMCERGLISRYHCFKSDRRNLVEILRSPRMYYRSIFLSLT